jgi:hypothetical protein
MMDMPPITTPLLQPMEYWDINACMGYYPWRTVEEVVKSTEGKRGVMLR